ncbi:CBS domain-containing protein [Paraburkholderia sp. JHI869]|uniref:CBS domain-containing protein n=1 Tax=Paraburkholderia sp. JHI869 TaxID=3112959 RepID=UPI00316F80F0
MRAFDVMTSSVVTAHADMTIHEAARLFVDNRIGGMPVVDANGQVVGIVTHRDLLHRVENGTGHSKRAWWFEVLASSPRDEAARYVKEHGRLVGDVMSDHVISIAEDTPLQQIADLMERRHLKRVPVLKDGKLVGIVCRGNLIRALANVEPVVDGQAHDDASLRDAIVREMHGQRWGLPKQSVIVKDGVAHLWGVIETDEEKRAIRIAAEGVPGIKRVESHVLQSPGVIPTL